MHGSSRSLVLAGVISGIAASAAVATIHLNLAHSGSWAAMLGLGAGAGLVAGVALRLGEVLTRNLAADAALPIWRQPRLLARAALLWAPFALANLDTFSGAWISQRGYAPLLQAGFHSVGLAGALALLGHAATLGVTPLRRWATATAALLIAVTATVLDSRILVGLYPGLHASLGLAGILSFTLAAWSLLPRTGPLPRRMAVACALVAGISAAIVVHGDGVMRTRLAGTNPVQVQTLAWLTPADALDAWRGKETAARTFLARRTPHIEAGSPAALALDQRLPGRRAMNLLLVSVDTMRADRLQACGATQSVTPFIDGLAQRSAVFTRAYTSYPTSSPAYSSMFTALMPSLCPAGVINRAEKPVWDGKLALADLLAGAGFHCLAWSAFNAETIARENVMGHLTAGFAEFTPERRIIAWDGADLVDAARASLQRLAGRRNFLWLHLLDAHAPYKERAGHIRGNGVIAAYDSELSYVDEQLRRLFEDLDAKGSLKNTIVVVMGDHGEAFGEHGHRFHATSLYEEQMRVPLIIHVPGLPATRIDEPVSIMDIFPTVTDLLDVRDAKERDGNSLVPALLGLAPVPGYACGELFASQHTSQGGKRMVVAEGFKLIVDDALGTTELYDLRRDREELTNIASSEPARKNFLLALLNVVQGERRGSSQLEALDAALALMRSDDPEERQRGAWELHRRAMDPLFGLSRGCKELLQGALRKRALQALTECIRNGPVEAGRPALTVGCQIDAAALLEMLEGLEPVQDAGWKLEYTLLRAAAGDKGVSQDILTGLALDGTPEMPRVALHALHLDLPVAPDLLLASVRSPYVHEASQLLREVIRRGRQQDVLPLLLDLEAHPHWELYAPIRTAATDVLLGTPDTEITRHLLARLARDDDTELAARALAGLSRLAGAATRRWMDAADLGLRAWESLVHRDANAALLRLADAVALCPENSLTQLELARLEQLYGRSASAEERLRSLTTRGDFVASEAKRRICHPENVPAWTEGPLELALSNLSFPTQALCQTIACGSFDVRNASSVSLPGGLLPVQTCLKVTLVGKDGLAQDALASEFHLGSLDLAPGETRRIHGALFVPDAFGTWRVVIEGRLTLPSGEVRVIPVTGAEGLTITIDERGLEPSRIRR